MDNSWHHFCLTWRADTGLARLFLDGVLRVELKDVQVGAKIEANGVFQLGRGSSSSSDFLGQMTGVNVWDSALSGFAVSAMAKASGCEAGNVISWDSFRTAVTHGSVVFRPTSSYVQSKGEPRGTRRPRLLFDGRGEFILRNLAQLVLFSD